MYPKQKQCCRRKLSRLLIKEFLFAEKRRTSALQEAAEAAVPEAFGDRYAGHGPAPAAETQPKEDSDVHITKRTMRGEHATITAASPAHASYQCFTTICC